MVSFFLGDNRVDLITCLTVLHHVPHLDDMLAELVRILRPGGYLIVREHDCKNERSYRAKYLNFVHLFMRIARVGEFSRISDDDEEGTILSTSNWSKEKEQALEYTYSIQYRTREQWQKQLGQYGFRLIGQIDFMKGPNPQALYYDIFQLDGSAGKKR